MAKYRHRIFEMYELCDEATQALTTTSACPDVEAMGPESLPLTHLGVSRLASVVHFHFKNPHILGDETVNHLREDFSKLADWLVRDSKVLLDFSGVESFCAASIDELVLFQQKLRIKGSRIALCRLNPMVKQTFFKRSNGHEKR